jgi:hypothetical protein
MGDGGVTGSTEEGSTKASLCETSYFTGLVLSRSVLVEGLFWQYTVAENNRQQVSGINFMSLALS